MYQRKLHLLDIRMNLIGTAPVSRYRSSLGVFACFERSEINTVLKSCSSIAYRSEMFLLMMPTQDSEFARTDERNRDPLSTENASYLYGPRQNSANIWLIWLIVLNFKCTLIFRNRIYLYCTFKRSCIFSLWNNRVFYLSQLDWNSLTKGGFVKELCQEYTKVQQVKNWKIKSFRMKVTRLNLLRLQWEINPLWISESENIE